MDTIQNSPLRLGRFTSSEINRLYSKGKREMTQAELDARPKKGKGSSTTFVAEGFGTAALSYINEKRLERRLGRSLNIDSNTFNFAWGHLAEHRAFSLIGLDYTLSSEETNIHPTIDFWSGSKDGIKHDEGKTILEIKSPTALTSFCSLVEPIYLGMEGMDAINYVRENHDDGEKYYKQIVSNSIINDAKYGELCVYMPYKSEIAAIKELASEWHDPNEMARIYFATENQIPWIPDDGYYKNVNIIRFEIPQSDKDEMTQIVIEAGKLLNK